MDAVEEVKSRLSIEDVISEYVELKRAGRNFKGLSPFSNEKTASFMVSPEKQIWHDFSSGKGGNMFSFVMEMEGVDFKAALEKLARKAGVDLSQYQTGSMRERSEQKERLLQALELAANFYQRHLMKKREALEYLRTKRGYSKEIILQFRLGYSPDNGSELSNFLTKKGYKPEELTKAGLSNKGYRGEVRDMFRGRIMVPLMDGFGKVIGFTARLLKDEPNSPKYINTPQTLLYDKGRHIYGLHLAKDAIRKDKFAVVVEGNLDVIASHQAGVKSVVATAGTAMTEMHLKGLTRLTSDVRLSFDQDTAGLAAAERVIPIASKLGLGLNFITIPEGKDPDELIKKSPGAWEKAITKPAYAVDWLIDRYSKQLDIKSAQGKRQFSDIVLKVVAGLTDQVEQDHYVKKIAQVLDVNADALFEKLGQLMGKTTQRRLKITKLPEQPAADKIEVMKLQNQLLALATMQPKLRNFLESVTPGMLIDESARKILEFLKKNPDADGNLIARKELQEVSDYVKILSLQFEELYGAVDELELQYEAARLRTRLIEHYAKTQKAALAKALTTADEAASKRLLESAKKIDMLLKSVSDERKRL